MTGVVGRLLESLIEKKFEDCLKEKNCPSREEHRFYDGTTIILEKGGKVGELCVFSLKRHLILPST